MEEVAVKLMSSLMLERISEEIGERRAKSDRCERVNGPAESMMGPGIMTDEGREISPAEIRIGTDGSEGPSTFESSVFNLPAVGKDKEASDVHQN